MCNTRGTFLNTRGTFWSNRGTFGTPEEHLAHQRDILEHKRNIFGTPEEHMEKQRKIWNYRGIFEHQRNARNTRGTFRTQEKLSEHQRNARNTITLTWGSWRPWRRRRCLSAVGTPPGGGRAGALTGTAHRSSCWWRRRPTGRSPPPGNLTQHKIVNLFVTRVAPMPKFECGSGFTQKNGNNTLNQKLFFKSVRFLCNILQV